MITRTRVATISRLAFPMTVAIGSALAIPVIDLAMVAGLGTATIAAVGLAVFFNELLWSIMLGLAPAVQGLVSRREGESSAEPRCLPLNAGLVTAVAAGIPLTILCYAVGPYVFASISSDPEVTRIGSTFLATLYLGVTAAGINSAFRGHWLGMGRPNVYMATVLFTVGVKFVLNYILIYGHFGAPALGPTGAAIGTVGSLYAAALLNVAIARVDFKDEGFLGVKPSRSLLLRVVKMGLPAMIQGTFFYAGWIVFFWLVGQVGTAELAAANVLVRLMMILVVVAMSLGTACATLVSKTMGEGDPSGAAEWGWDTVKLGVTTVTVLGLPGLLFPEFFLALFLTDPGTIAIAIVPLQLTALTIGVGSLVYMLAYTLYTLGDGVRVMAISFGTQWILFLPAVWFVGPHLRYGLVQIWMVNIGYGAIAALLITAIWAGGRWKTIEV